MSYRYCDYCGEEYYAKRSSSRFCNSSCRTKNHQSQQSNYDILNARNSFDYKLKQEKVKGMQLACKQINKKLKKAGVNLKFGVFIDEEKDLTILRE